MTDKWKRKVRVEQQNFANALSDRLWDGFDRFHDAKELTEKIAFAFVGPPKSSGYSKEQDQLVSEIIEKCVECCNNEKKVCVAFLFICVYQKPSVEATFPLLRVIKDNGTNTKLSYFIDHVGRVYRDWSDFLSNNVFDGSWICIPKDAKYSVSSKNQVHVEFHDQSDRGKVLGVLDEVSTVNNFASSATMVIGFALSFIPPIAPIGAGIMIISTVAATPGALYSTGRSIGTLVDKGTHKQSINPFLSSEARACWLTTAASVFSYGAMASGTILAATAKAGLLAGSGTRVFCTALNVSTLSVSGLGIINSIYEVSKKEKVTALDVVQISSSILFFTHATVTFKTASAIIKDAQEITIEAKKDMIARDKKDVFDAMQRSRQDMVEPGKTRIMHGNKEFIRELRRIENPEEFFDHFQLVKGNQISVANELVIDPKAFLQMEDPERHIIMKNCSDLRNNNIQEAQFNKNVSSVKSKYRIDFDRNRANASKRIANAFDGSHVNELILSNLNPNEIDRVDQVFSQSGKNYNPKCLEVAKEMSERMECKTVNEFIAVSEFAMRRLDKQAQKLRKTNPKPVKPAGIKDRDFFFGKVTDDFLNNRHNKQIDLVQEFSDLMRECNRNNSAGNLRFSDAMTAANHYDKHGHSLSTREYIDLAGQITSDKDKHPKWTQDGSSLMKRFTSERNNAFAVRYDNISEKKSTIATLMSLQKKKNITVQQVTNRFSKPPQ